MPFEVKNKIESTKIDTEIQNSEVNAICNTESEPIINTSENNRLNDSVTDSVNQHLLYFNDFDIIVDSVFGFSFSGPPRDPFRTLIKAISKTKIPVLSVDVPSGNKLKIRKNALKILLNIVLFSIKFCVILYFFPRG